MAGPRKRPMPKPFGEGEAPHRHSGTEVHRRVTGMANIAPEKGQQLREGSLRPKRGGAKAATKVPRRRA